MTICTAVFRWGCGVIYALVGDSISVGGSERASSSDASDNGSTPNAPRTLGVAFALSIVLKGGSCDLREEETATREEAAAFVRCCSSPSTSLASNVGEPSICEDTSGAFRCDLGVGELCSGSGLSEGSPTEFGVEAGVNGEAVGRFGDWRPVAGLLESSASFTA